MGAAASAASDKNGFCSWCFARIPNSEKKPLKLRNQDGSEFSLTRCPHKDCERLVRKCMSPECPHHACVDSYTISSCEKNIYISRNDHFCAFHLHVVGSFEKATRFRQICSLAEYSSIHANGLGNGGIAESMGEAVSVLVCHPIQNVLEIAASSVSNMSLELVLLNPLETAIKGIATKRYHSEKLGMPLGSAASAVAAYAVYKNMPVFREKGFITERQGDSNLPIVITIDGFLHSSQDSQVWSKLVNNAFPHNSWISLQWDAAGKAIWAQESWINVSNSFQSVVSQIPGAFVSSVLGGGLSAFQAAKSNCEQTAFLLADALTRLDDSKRVILLGHSMGASLIYHTLCLMAESRQAVQRAEFRDSKLSTDDLEQVPRRGDSKVERVILLGSACPHKQETKGNLDGWTFASMAVNRHILNLYSEQDEVLNAMGTVFGVQRAGVRPIETNAPTEKIRNKILNVQCREVCGHFDWKPSVSSTRLSDV